MNIFSKFPLTPAIITLAVVILSLITVIFSALASGTPIPLIVTSHNVGFDFRDLYDGGLNLAAGKSLYLAYRFVTPPLSAHIMGLFTFLTIESAIYLYMWLNLIFFSAGTLVVARVFAQYDQHIQALLCGIVLTVGLLSYPLHFLIQRGNIDGMVFLFVMLTLFAWRKFSLSAGVLLAVAFSLKVYPALLIIAAIVERRWRTLLGFLGALLVSIIYDFTHWREFLFERLLRRASFFEAADNMSFSAAYYLLREESLKLFGYSPPFRYEVQVAYWAGTVTFAVLMIAAIFMHLKMRQRQLPLVRFAPFLYLPLMVSVPAHVYPYSHVMNIPLLFLLCALWSSAVSQADRRRIAIVSLLLGLSFINTFSLRIQLDSFSYVAIAPLARLIGIFFLYFQLYLESNRTHNFSLKQEPEPLELQIRGLSS